MKTQSDYYAYLKKKPGHTPSHLLVYGSMELFSYIITTLLNDACHTYQQEYGSQLGKLANPARSRLRILSRETGSAAPSRVSLLISIHRRNLVLTYGIPPEFRGGVPLFI